jgi:transposase
MEETPPPQDKNKRLESKLKLVTALQAGTAWQEALQTADLTLSRATTYRYLKAFQKEGEAALQDGRKGHPAKLKAEVQAWLVEYCQPNQQLPSRQVQLALKARFGITVSISRLNEVRAALGIARSASRTDLKKKLSS